MSIIADYHMHTPLCKHAAGPMEAYVECAIDRGLREIGFSDHNPLPYGFGANVRMAEEELEYYVKRVTELQFQYRGQINVLLGIELDFVEGIQDYLAKQIERYPFDYVIGSVHYLDPECRIGSWTRHYQGTPDEQWIEYCALLRKLARSGLCDIMAHLDVVNRSTKQPTQRGLDELSRTLEDIATTGVCVEINTSGYRHTELAHPQPYPDLPFVKLAIKLGVPLMVNSDSHMPEQVGFMFKEMEQFLLKHGCQQLARFEGRQRSFYNL